MPRGSPRVPLGDDGRHAAGVGPGLRYNIDPFLSARVDVGFKLHRLEPDSPLTHWHFSVIASY